MIKACQKVMDDLDEDIEQAFYKNQNFRSQKLRILCAKSHAKGSTNPRVPAPCPPPVVQPNPMSTWTVFLWRPLPTRHQRPLQKKRKGKKGRKKKKKGKKKRRKERRKSRRKSCN